MSWSGANSVLRIVLGFFSAKVSALFLGPAGMALVGEIANFIQVSTGAIANGAQTAVVNLTAERRSSPARLQELWATAIWSVLLLSGLVALVVLSSASTLSAWLLFDAKYWPVIVAGGFVVMLAVVDTVLIGALNGLKQIKLIASASIACTIVEFILFAGLTYTFGIWGGLVGMTAVYGSKLAVSSWIAFRSKLISPRALFSSFDRATLRDIWKFYPMLIAHSIALPLAQLLVRRRHRADPRAGAGRLPAGRVAFVGHVRRRDHDGPRLLLHGLLLRRLKEKARGASCCAGRLCSSASSPPAARRRSICCATSSSRSC